MIPTGRNKDQLGGHGHVVMCDNLRMNHHNLFVVVAGLAFYTRRRK